MVSASVTTDPDMFSIRRTCFIHATEGAWRTGLIVSIYGNSYCDKGCNYSELHVSVEPVVAADRYVTNSACRYAPGRPPAAPRDDRLPPTPDGLAIRGLQPGPGTTASRRDGIVWRT